jgi:hypothetical protein
MTFDIIIAAMTAKHGINPEWGGCRPGILANASQDYTFLVGHSPIGFSATEVELAIAEWINPAVAVDAAVFANTEFQVEAEPELAVFTLDGPTQVEAVIVTQTTKKKGGKK